VELFALYDTETSSYHGGSSSGPSAFLPRLRRTPTVIAALPHSHVAAFDDFEFAGMVDGSRDFIFNTLFMDSNSGQSSPLSSEEDSSTVRRMKTTNFYVTLEFKGKLRCVSYVCQRRTTHKMTKCTETNVTNIITYRECLTK
jgi:hypothetical protein